MLLQSGGVFLQCRRLQALDVLGAFELDSVHRCWQSVGVFLCVCFYMQRINPTETLQHIELCVFISFCPLRFQ